MAKAEADLQFAKEGGSGARRVPIGTEPCGVGQGRSGCSALSATGEQEAAPQIDLDTALAQQQVLREEANARKAELTQTKLQQRAQIALAAAELEFARATQRLAELNLNYTEIKAPVNGRIGESNIFVGGLATANSTQPSPCSRRSIPFKSRLLGEREYLNYIQKASTEAERSGRAADLAFQLPGGWQYYRHFLVVCLRIAPSTCRRAPWKSPWISPTQTSPLLPGTFSRVRVQTGERVASSWCHSARLESYRWHAVPCRQRRQSRGGAYRHGRGSNRRSLGDREGPGGGRSGEGLQRVQPGVKVQPKAEPEPKLEQTTQSAVR